VEVTVEGPKADVEPAVNLPPTYCTTYVRNCL
jgi:hypothetical protein